MEQATAGGKHFELTPREQRPYALLHDSDPGRFLLTSDSVLATFTLPSVPRSLADYLVFCERTIEFVTARNERINISDSDEAVGPWRPTSSLARSSR